MYDQMRGREGSAESGRQGEAWRAEWRAAWKVIGVEGESGVERRGRREQQERH
jgi:hypothetical protein